jgi:hypothetical protein
MGLDEADTARAFVKSTGDGVLIELGSVVGTVRYAIGLQKRAAEPRPISQGFAKSPQKNIRPLRGRLLQPDTYDTYVQTPPLRLRSLCTSHRWAIAI